MTGPIEELRGRIVLASGVLEGGIVRLHGDRIVSIDPARAPFLDGPGRVDTQGCYVYPGFLNLHVHGAVGRDFADQKPDSPGILGTYLAGQGYTGFLATYVSSPLPSLTTALAHLTRAVDACLPDMEGVLGVHLEGPFLNPDRRGAHRLEDLVTPSVEALGSLLAPVPAGVATLVTIAPELPGASAVIDLLRCRGAIPAFGHSTATCSQTVGAIRRGVRHAVHLFNAMEPFHHREPGAPGAFLTTPGTTVEVIPDLVHLHEVTLRLVLAARGVEGVVVSTDSIPPTGLGEGTFSWLGRTVTVKGERASLPDGTLAGSVLGTARMLEVLSDLGLAPPQIAQVVATNPARAIGLDRRIGSIAPGLQADFTVVDPAGRPAMIVRRGVPRPA
jgi:N-acetylglucosamine-6-phosphate deacetylase